MRTFRGVRRGAAAAACAIVGASLLIALLSSDAQPRRSPELVRLALLNATRGESERAPAGTGGVHGGLTRDYKRGTRVTARIAGAAATNTFGQPTIAGIGGWGFEADLRLDPSNANRLYMSSPDSANADGSFIWRSLDGGKTFKWVPGAAPLGGKVTTCHGGGDTELAVDPAGPPLLQRPDARQLQRRTFGRLRPNVHVQQHRRPRHDRRSSVVRARRRPDGRRLALPHQRRSVQRQRPVRKHAAQQHARHVSLTCRGRGRVRRGSRSARQIASRCRARATRGSWATTRSARSQRKRA